MVRNASLTLLSLGAFCVAGCGGGSAPPPVSPTITSVSVSCAAASLQTGQTSQCSATVSGTGSYSSGVLWSAVYGTVSSSGLYTAPATVPASGADTVKATSTEDSTKSGTASITITPPTPITVSFSPRAPGSVQAGSSVPLSAEVANDSSANPQVAWAVSCSASSCGSFSSTTTASEVATTYTAPAAIPPGGSVTVTATSATDPAKSNSASILITPAAPTLANGTYVFQLSGDVNDSDSFITGALVAKDGAITGGEQDSLY